MLTAASEGGASRRHVEHHIICTSDVSALPCSVRLCVCVSFCVYICVMTTDVGAWHACKTRRHHKQHTNSGRANNKLRSALGVLSPCSDWQNVMTCEMQC